MSSVEELNSSIMRRLEEVRRAARVSQTDLGRRTGVNQSTVSQALTSKHPNTSLRVMVRLASALGMDIELTMRYRNPMTTRFVPQESVFRCFCGSSVIGPVGEVQECWKDGRWQLWMGQGGAFGDHVAEHCRTCEHAQQRYKVEIV